DPLHDRSPSMHDTPDLPYRASSVKYQPRSNRYYFDVGIGSVCLSGADTGGTYCLLEAGLAPGMSVPRHTHTRTESQIIEVPDPSWLVALVWRANSYSPGYNRGHK